MKLFVLVLFAFNLIQGDSDESKQGLKIIDCIPHKPVNEKILDEYSKIQIVTDLIHLPLRDIARREVVPERNGDYNVFLACSWKKYGYQTKQGVVAYDAIERALKDALVREVGATGPGMNLSKMEAKNIINQCRNITGLTHGGKAVQVQNCILKQIQHFG